MIRPSEPIDIFDMFTPKEKAENERLKQERILMQKTCLFIKTAFDEKQSKEAIFDQVKKVDLPLNIHLAVSGKFSEICKYGRILTDRERKILSF